MATFILMNTVRLKGASGPIVLTAGRTIDDAKTPTAPITAAGGVLAATADTSVAAAAVLAVKMKKGGRDYWEMNDVMLAAGLKQLGLT
jgi:hypothetical protein